MPVFARLLLLLCSGLVWSLPSVACGVDDVRLCKKRFEQLIAHRATAIQDAFGDPFALPEKIAVDYFYADDPRYGHLRGQVAYDAERNVILISRALMHAEFPNPLANAQYYWPFYQDDKYREQLRIVGLIDNALWTAFLQEAAQAHGLSWPHAGCSSTDVGKRLPCEMVMAGIVEHLTSVRLPIFNESRLDLIWPDDYSQFASSVWLQDAAYKNVKRYGGILLMRPLIARFGVIRAMAYAAQRPFEVREDSLRVAALRYQREAYEDLGGPPLAGLSAITHVDVGH